MKKCKIQVFFIILFLILPLSTISKALDVDTHEEINLRITGLNINGFVLDSFLKTQLGFKNGVKDIYDKYRVEQWLSLGGHFEDKPPGFVIPYRRSFNHFHNPLTEEGFNGFLNGSPFSGTSLVVWAQLPIGTQYTGGNYSWRDVRYYYFSALTSIDKTTQENLYGETFRGLGQLMHLVQDASVPSHTRNDAHLILDYESWVKKNLDIIKIDPVFYDKSILSRPNSRLPIAPLENIFDTNQYDGTNPEVTAGKVIGLTEYTSANFFSEDTINSPQFPYPKLDNTQIVDRLYLSVFGDPYTRKYYFKNCCGETNSGNGYLLSAVDYLDYWRKKFKPSDIFSIKPVLDDNVYKEYASLLLPRAMGYSAGLLEYFFRGKLQVTAVPIFYKGDLSFMKLKIKNMTPDETMRNGEFVLTYRYTHRRACRWFWGSLRTGLGPQWFWCRSLYRA